MNPDRKLLLLPVDGSDQSMENIRYVSKVVNLTEAEVVLLSVIDKAPEIFWETGKDTKVDDHHKYMSSWNEYKEGKMRECMGDACKILEAAGLPGSAITCNTVKRNEGVARDILNECKFGYNAVVIGRRGLGRMDESMLGSIAAKVFINACDSPVCLLGGAPTPGKIMIGVDQSLSTIRSVNFVARMLKPEDSTVAIVHVARLPQEEGGAMPDDQGVQEIIQECEIALKPVFENAVRTLTAAGFAPGRITTRVIKGAGSRAVNLYNEAVKGQFGTLVVGRRGIKDVQEFTMGRIPYKLGQIARNIALWLVP
jgi:nucleotide-binding universal stress UspA family protein